MVGSEGALSMKSKMFLHWRFITAFSFFNQESKSEEFIQAFLFAVYSTGSCSTLIFLKHLGFTLFSNNQGLNLLTFHTGAECDCNSLFGPFSPSAVIIFHL